MIKLAGAFCLLSVLAGQAWSEDFSGAQVLKVSADKDGLLQEFVQEHNLDVWSGNASHLDVLVPDQILGAVKTFLWRNRIDFGVMIPDLEEAIAAESQPTPTPRTTSRAGYSMNWGQFHRLSTIHDFLDALARTYPSFVSVGTMGRSHEGRQLKYIKISSGLPNARAVFIDGGIHAREWASPAAVTYVIRELVENRSQLPRDVQQVDFYILPLINPDGYEFTHTSNRMWRKNRSPEGGRCAGADINRNFDFKFGGEGTSGDACSDIYRGKGAASEPETKALQSFLTSISSNLKAYITFHSYGQYILVPYGYQKNQFAPDFNEMKAVGDAAARAIRSATGASYTVGNTANTLYPAAGGSDDWVKAKLPGVKYAYCIELRDTGRGGFVLPTSEIPAAGLEAFEAIKVIAAAASKA